ncbi:hypothetical protein L1049_002138 [Liquidambar formosana]|uniref:Uncharacterized protein n=1 Tax=Liquidambar formosana TaxID=63359 RepID=A0AAP0NH70_LIQFO
MARVPCKRLVLVAFFLLCFISTTAKARNLRTGNNEAERGHDDLLIPKEDGAPVNVEELVTVDYTPARKKPPIHN